MTKRYSAEFRWLAPKIDVGDGWPSGLRRTPGKCTRQKCDFRHRAGFTYGRSRYSRNLPVPIAGFCTRNG